MKNDSSKFITDPAELGAILHLPERFIDDAHHVAADYPFRIPRSLLTRIQPDDSEDPVLLQFFPRLEEKIETPGFVVDPLCELNGNGPLLRKYVGRVLLMTDGPCAACCRFCFRRHFPKGNAVTDWGVFLRPIESDPSVTEIILSGGDPLGLSDRRLTLLFDYIKGLRFVKRVRVHTRYPIMIPERITAPLLDSLTRLNEAGKRVVIIFHLNHPAEIDDQVGQMFRRLTASGAILFSQTVLLRDINDDPRTLATLFEKEISFAVVPYYLHQLDHVAGGAHFEVSEEKGVEIVRELRRILPGYLVPRYVQEIPGAPAKTPLGP